MLVITRGLNTIESHSTTIFRWFSYGFPTVMTRISGTPPHLQRIPGADPTRCPAQSCRSPQRRQDNPTRSRWENVNPRLVNYGLSIRWVFHYESWFDTWRVLSQLNVTKTARGAMKQSKYPVVNKDVITGWWFVYLPLWKIWIRQLGWWLFPKTCSKPPTSYSDFDGDVDGI